MVVATMAVRRFRRPKTVDVVFPLTIAVYMLWPWWAIHGGPQPPRDLGTVVMGILGWFGTAKALDVGTKNKHVKEDDDDDDLPRGVAQNDKPHR